MTFSPFRVFRPLQPFRVPLGGKRIAPEFILQMQTTTASESITLPMTTNVDVNIDWGDGTTESVTTDSPSHTFATAGTYDIKVTGSCNAFAFNESASAPKLLHVLNGGTAFTAGSFTNGFRGCTNLETADFAGLDTSSVTSMSSVFRECSSLTSLDVSGFDTSSATTMRFTFSNCSSLTTLDVSGFDTSSVTSMFAMFRNCNSLTSLDVSGFDTSSVTSMNNMFDSCSSLTSDPGIHAFDVTALTTAENMCAGANAMLSEAEYNTILVNWEAQAVNDNVSVHFGGSSVYSGAGATARAALIADHAWTITDGGPA